MGKEETSTMGLSVCPAAVVKAPVEVVWGFLAYPEKFNEWVDGRVEHIEPAGPAVVGQAITVTAPAFGRRWPAFFKVEKVDRETDHLNVVPLNERNVDTCSMIPFFSTTGM